MDTPLKIVYIEDHDALREVTAEVLRGAGFHVTSLWCAEDLDEQVGGDKVDIFILDLNLPGEDGLSLARRLRTAHPHIGLIMITARDSQEDMVEGYNSGADVYLAKPVTTDLLLATVQSMSQRLKRALSYTDENRFYLQERSLMLQGNAGSQKLQASEARLLKAFIRSVGSKLDIGQIAEQLGQNDESFSKGSLEVRIARLRKKFIACGALADAIKAIRGEGYQLTVIVEVMSL